VSYNRRKILTVECNSFVMSRSFAFSPFQARMDFPFQPLQHPELETTNESVHSSRARSTPPSPKHKDEREGGGIRKVESLTGQKLVSTVVSIHSA